MASRATTWLQTLREAGPPPRSAFSRPTPPQKFRPGHATPPPPAPPLPLPLPLPLPPVRGDCDQMELLNSRWTTCQKVWLPVFWMRRYTSQSLFRSRRGRNASAEAGKSRRCGDDHANDDALHGDEDNEDEEDDDGVEALRSDDEFGGAGETTGGTDEALEKVKDEDDEEADEDDEVEEVAPETGDNNNDADFARDGAGVGATSGFIVGASDGDVAGGDIAASATAFAILGNKRESIGLGNT